VRPDLGRRPYGLALGWSLSRLWRFFFSPPSFAINTRRDDRKRGEWGEQVSFGDSYPPSANRSHLIVEPEILCGSPSPWWIRPVTSFCDCHETAMPLCAGVPFSSARSDDRKSPEMNHGRRGRQGMACGRPRPRFIAGAGDATASALLPHKHLLRSSQAGDAHGH
jgi:hypothetical protein